MKTAAEIAADCGLGERGEDTLLAEILEERLRPLDPNEAAYFKIIGALYRRIEKLEEERVAYRDWIDRATTLLCGDEAMTYENKYKLVTDAEREHLFGEEGE